MREEITKYYNDLAKDYDADRFSNSYGQYVHGQEDRIIGRYLDEKKAEFNLDLACGTGRFLKYADFGADISKEMTEISKKKFPQKSISIQNAEDLSFEDSFFDNVLSFHLFMHLDERCMANILREVNRVLKKGGYFIFDVPSEKRRKLTGYRSVNWHGGNQISVQSLQDMMESTWEMHAFYGTVFLPIHRLPKKLRMGLVRFDNWMCNSFLKEYSSHLIFILKKK